MKKIVFYIIAPVVIIYMMMSLHMYQSIAKSEDKLAELHSKIELMQQSNKEIPFALRKDYSEELVLYKRKQGLLQSFWMKYVFQFKEYENLK